MKTFKVIERTASSFMRMNVKVTKANYEIVATDLTFADAKTVRNENKERFIVQEQKAWH